MESQCVGDTPETLNDQWVKLNVGGTMFVTTKLTLTCDPESFLCRICDENFGLKSSKDENGAYLIDRDPKYFRPILNYLRHGKLIVDDGLALEGILEEAEFYNLTALIKVIKMKMAQPPQYKVMRCCLKHSLQGRIRNIEPGWKFEQLVFQKGPDESCMGEDDEYLIVTSKNTSSSSG